MPKGYQLFLFAALGCVAVVFGWLLQPEQPNLTGDSGYREKSANYRAGGSSCEPSKIRALPIGLREGKADACAEAEEQHRATSNNLIEARRAANAADAAAIVAYQQTRIAAWGFGAGIVTLFAAIAAALFAERAAHHTKRSADIAEEALRPWLDISVITHEAFLRENELFVRLQAVVTNIGARPANDVHADFRLRHPRGKMKDGNFIVDTSPINFDFGDREQGTSILPNGKHTPGFRDMTIPKCEILIINKDDFYAITFDLDVSVKYRSIENSHITTREYLCIVTIDGKPLTVFPSHGENLSVTILPCEKNTAQFT